VTPLQISGGTPIDCFGTAEERGLAQAANARPADIAEILAATVGRVATARGDGVIDADAEAYLTAQYAFTQANDPQSLAEVRGIAKGFNVSEADIFAHLHLGTLRDLKSGARLDSEGCSSWAVSNGPEGPMVVKNRDLSGPNRGVQTVARHRGPDISVGAMLCVGSFGSPGAYSSGMNEKGLALVDTQVAVATHRVGWLRYFLMTRLLASCATVAEACAFLKSTVHAGGGTLVLADSYGFTAAVELGASGPVINTGPAVWRTNHYVTEELAADTLYPDGDRIAGNSRARFAFLENALADQDWGAEDAARLMAVHATDDRPFAAPLCQHPETDACQTFSSAVYSCRVGSLMFSAGNPCAGKWRTYQVLT
jgi:isopenicillin-N N-acyltransferase-like protein